MGPVTDARPSTSQKAIRHYWIVEVEVRGLLCTTAITRGIRTGTGFRGRTKDWRVGYATQTIVWRVAIGPCPSRLEACSRVCEDIKLLVCIFYILRFYDGIAV